MARSRRDTCKAILQALEGRGIDTTCTRKELMKAIVDVAGSTRETREAYMRELKKGQFIRQIDGGSFQLNFAAVDDDEDLSLIGDLTRRVEALEKEVKSLVYFVRGETDE